MKKKDLEYAEKMMSKLLMEKIREEIDMDIIKTITDPNHVPQTTPIKFKSEEDEKAFAEHYKKMWDERNDFLKDYEE